MGSEMCIRDRLSYTRAYTKTGIRLFLPDKGVAALDDYLDAVGFYNNGETVAYYTDRHRPREDQKKRLEDRGLSRELLRTFYRNPSFTNRERIAFVDSLESFGTQPNLEPIITKAAMAPTRYEAVALIDRYRYLSCLLYTSPSPRDRTRSRMPSSA